MVRNYAPSEGETFCAQPETRVEAWPDFFICIRHNPLKSPDSEKETKGNASAFPFISLHFLASDSRFGCICGWLGDLASAAFRCTRAGRLSLEQQAAGRIVDGPVAGGDDSAPFGGVFPVPGRHHSARPLDDRRERDDVVRFEVGLDHQIDEACRERAIGVTIAAVAREPDLLFDPRVSR